MDFVSSNANSTENLNLIQVNKYKQLEQTNIELLERLKHLEVVCTTLNNENVNLKKEIDKLKLSAKTNEDVDHQSQHVYLTDEEELQRETEWTVQPKRAKKKRKAASSPTINDDTTIVIETQNTQKNVFISNNQKSENKANPNQMPPPIMAVGIENFKDFSSLLKSCSKTQPITKILQNNTIKINTNNSDDYRSVTKALSDKCIPWYTYENKQVRPIKVMFKNIHHSCDPSDILLEIKDQGYKVLSVQPKYKWKTKEPLDMFMVTFEPTENIDKIYKIKQILNCVIKVVPIKQPKLVPQCKNCQSFEHTKNFCSRLPRCVKCAGDHSTVECKKSAETEPKCCNCGKAHPANYRGCEVAKQLQQKRNEIRKLKRQEQIGQQNPSATNLEKKSGIKNDTPKTSFTKKNIAKTSFADVLKNKTKNDTNNYLLKTDPTTQILEMLKKQEMFYNTLEQRLERLETKLNQ